MGIATGGTNGGGTGGAGGSSTSTTSNGGGTSTTSPGGSAGAAGSPTTDGTGGTTNEFVACDDAEGGEPCQAFEMCGPLDGYGCVKLCIDGTWDVTCTEPPTCAELSIEQGLTCDAAWGPPSCGPFEIDSACGEVSAMAHCQGTFGWYYELPCDPDCESLAETECKANAGCVWAVSCESEVLEVLEPRCVDFPPVFGGCTNAECPTDTSCVEVALNPSDPSSGDCSGAGALAGLCVP